MAIYFYNVNDEHGYMSNFSLYGIRFQGVYWKTSEHFYQAQKFTDSKVISEIINADTPLEAAIIAHSNEKKVVKNWLQIRDKAMYLTIQLKFSQNDDIREKLLLTRYEILVENSCDDYYWGCGLTKDGKNQLGKTLMLYRDIGIYMDIRSRKYINNLV